VNLNEGHEFSCRPVEERVSRLLAEEVEEVEMV